MIRPGDLVTGLDDNRGLMYGLGGGIEDIWGVGNEVLYLVIAVEKTEGETILLDPGSMTFYETRALFLKRLA